MKKVLMLIVVAGMILLLASCSRRYIERITFGEFVEQILGGVRDAAVNFMQSIQECYRQLSEAVQEQMPNMRPKLFCQSFQQNDATDSIRKYCSCQKISAKTCLRPTLPLPTPKSPTAAPILPPGRIEAGMPHFLYGSAPMPAYP